MSTAPEFEFLFQEAVPSLPRSRRNLAASTTSRGKFGGLNSGANSITPSID